jgi:hypothetical protein
MRPELAHLFTRPFWLDEWHTAMVANRATLPELFSDLYRGSDLGPPLLHLIAWTLARIDGHVPPTGARLVSFCSVFAALVFVYLILRRRVGRVSSVAGALAVASHSLVVFHAFEFRYYCLWLGFCAAVAWTLGIDRQLVRSRRRDVALAVLSVLLCLTHWLAAGTLILMCAGAAATFGRDWRAGLRRVAPAVAGLATVVLGLPLVRAQRASVVQVSWMKDPGLRDVLHILDMYWAGAVVIAAVLVILVALVLPSLKSAATGMLSAASRDPSIVAVVALFALPLGMVVVSLSFPAMHTRYSITTALASAPLVACAVEILGLRATGPLQFVAMRAARGGIFLIALVLLWANALSVAIYASQQALTIDASRRYLSQACRQNLPVVFQTRHVMYQTTDGNLGAWGGCQLRYMALSDATIDRIFRPGTTARRFYRFENEIARLHEGIYDYPRVWTEAHVDSLPRFMLFGWDDSLPPGYKSVQAFAKAVFPGHAVTRLTEDVTLFERQ